MTRTVFSLPEHEAYRTAGGLEVSRTALRFTGGTALDELIELLDRRRGVVLSCGPHAGGRNARVGKGLAVPPRLQVPPGTP